MPQAIEARAFKLALPLTEAVLLQHDGRRVDDDHARVTIDHYPVVLPDESTCFACAHHGRDVQTAGHDSGV
jgi:hypothetical protein